jgi:hypothetical protein
VSLTTTLITILEQFGYSFLYAFRDRSKLKGEEGYGLTNLELTLKYLESYDYKEARMKEEEYNE